MLASSAKPFLPSPINIIDVGCHRSHWKDDLVKEFQVGYSIGIDPCNYGVGLRYSKFYQVAIINGSNQKLPFNEYIEPGCNSLLKMKTDSVVHNRSLPGWYVAWAIETKTNEYLVDCISLNQVISETPEVLPIHYIKIDTQGTDLEVVKSLGDYLKDVHFIQIEAVSSHDRDITLYEGQNLMEDDISWMESAGFKVMKIQDYSLSASPEADILFYNRKLYENI